MHTQDWNLVPETVVNVHTQDWNLLPETVVNVHTQDWNLLPETVVNATSVNSFRNHLDIFVPENGWV